MIDSIPWYVLGPGVLAGAAAADRGSRAAARSLRYLAHRITRHRRARHLHEAIAAERRVIEHEQRRHADLVRRDLAPLPAYSQRLGAMVAQLEQIQQRAAEAPPPSTPESTQKVVALLEHIRPEDRPSMLEVVQEETLAAQERARQQNAERMRSLSAMLPHWRSVRAMLPRFNRSIEQLVPMVERMDRHAERHEALLAAHPDAHLAHSPLIALAISALVLAVGAVAACASFALIAYPLAEMTGSAHTHVLDYLTGILGTAGLAALMILAVELFMGVVLLEALGATRLLPVIERLPRVGRRVIAAVAGLVVIGLMGIECGLAVMRHALMADAMATAAVLRDQAPDASAGHLPSWVPMLSMATQMTMSGVLPVALLFTGLALQDFAHSLRDVLEALAIGALRTLAIALSAVSAGLRIALSPVYWTAARLAQAVERALERRPAADPDHAALAMPSLWRRRPLDERRL